MADYTNDIEQAWGAFDFQRLTDAELNLIFSGCYVDLNSAVSSHLPSWAGEVPAHFNINSFLDNPMLLELSQHLMHEARLQGFDNGRQLCAAIILSAHPEYRVVRVENTDYFIVKPELLQEFLGSDYFKGYSVNCKVGVL